MIPFNPAPMTSYKRSIVTIHLSRTVSEINADFRRKSPIFPTPVYLTTPLKGFPLELGIGAGSEETRMMGLPDCRKSYKTGLAVLIQYWHVTDTQPCCRSIYCAYYIVRVKIIVIS